jgi:aspartyl/glutamyl-tRNA(Asn/Gln) amidotransferase C subunit
MNEVTSKPPNPFLSEEGIARIAALARIRIGQAEIVELSAQLEKILAHVDRLSEIPEQDLPVLPPEPATPLRRDEPKPGDGRVELARNASEVSHGHVAVPRVVEAAS